MYVLVSPCVIEHEDGSLEFASSQRHSRFTKKPHFTGVMQEVIKHTPDIFLCVCTLVCKYAHCTRVPHITVV